MNAPVDPSETGSAPVDHQVPRRIRAAYGVGAIADGAKNAAFNGFLGLYYTTILGLSGTLSGLAIFIALCGDAISDPLVGSISDRFRSRWGRRHPFMYFAALPMGLSVWALFSPPDGLTEGGLFAWLVTFAIAVRLFLTFYMVPSGALGPEMTTHYDERTTLVAYRWLFGWIGGSALVTTLGWLYFFSDDAVLAEQRLNASNYPAFGLFVGVLCATAILVSSLGTHEMIPRLKSPEEGDPGFSWSSFFSDARSAMQSHSLRILLASSLLGAAALGVSEVLGTYMFTWFWELHSDQLGVLAALQFVPLLLGFGMVRPLSEKLDKRRATMALSLFAILWGPLTVVLRFLGLAPENGSPMLVPFIVVHGFLLLAAAIQIGILGSSMVMDATDEHEYETGERREGTFIAVTTFTTKAVSGLGSMIGLSVLDLIDFPRQQAAAVGQVPEETIWMLGLIAGPGLTVFHLVSLIFLSRLRLTRERYDTISRSLQERRAITE